MERMEDKAFDRAIRDKLDNFHPEISAALWGKIEMELDKKEVIVPIGQKKRIPFLWLRVAASVVLLIGAFWGYVHRPREVVYLKGKTASEQLAVRPIEERVETAVKSLSIKKESIITRKKNKVIRQNQPFKEQQFEQAFIPNEMPKEQARTAAFMEEEVAKPVIGQNNLVFCRHK